MRKEKLEGTEPGQHPHAGHRQRLKNRFLREGCSFDHFEPHEVLELLLYFSIPRRDTNPIAHGLMERFHGFAQVCDASFEELCRTEGIGETSALLIKMIPAIGRFYSVDKYSAGYVIDSTQKAGEFIYPKFFGLTEETVYLACLDGANRVICCEKLFSGSVNRVPILVRKIVETALRVGAVSVLLAHNHPGGTAIPSSEDLVTTRKVISALRTVDISLLDHIIVAEDDYVSMAESGMLQ